MKRELPIIFITHGNSNSRFRTEYATKCLSAILFGIYSPRLYICIDRSDEYHKLQILDIINKRGFTNFKIVESNKNHFGYGYVANTGAKEAFNDGFQTVMLMEDDWLLTTPYDFTVLLDFIEAHPEYGMIKLFKKTHETKPITNAPNFIQECVFSKPLKNKYTCNLQCSIRSKKFFENNWLPENCSAANVEINSCIRYNKTLEKNQKILWFSEGQTLFRHIGERTNPNNIYISTPILRSIPHRKSRNNLKFQFG